jgi:hypothetical protein
MGDPVLQGILFALFAGFTAAIQAVIGPTYNGLLVPELTSGALFPPFPGGGGSLFAVPVAFSNYLLLHLVDPAVVLVALGLGLLYLARSFVGRENVRIEGALPRLVVYVVLANITVPVAGALLALAGAMYPTIAGFDGGAWQDWGNLAGAGGISFSWDNGAVAFVVSFVLFSLVLLLAAAIALRDALLAFLVVLLPLLTLAGALPPLRPLARRAWLLFGEAAFLPCLLVIPLELAVGAPSILLLAGYLTLALASPALLSVAGTQLTQLGFPGASGALSGGIQRGLSVASLTLGGIARPIGALSGSAVAGSRVIGRAAGAIGTASGAPLPAAAPLAIANIFGHGARDLFRHFLPEPSRAGGGAAGSVGSRSYRRFPPTGR